MALAAVPEAHSSRLSLPVQLWTPPTPPQDDNDIYIDSVMCLMYETMPIPESKLPPVYVRKERRRHRTDPSGGRCRLPWAPRRCVQGPAGASPGAWASSPAPGPLPWLAGAGGVLW